MRDAFISYSRRDRDIVNQVTTDLRRAGLTVWLDEIEIVAGENIVEKIENGITSSKHFVAFLSEAYSRSAFAREELTSALMATLSPAKRSVIPVRLDNTPMPQLLRARKYCDFRESYLSGYQELARALGILSTLPDFRIWTECVHLRLVPELRLATWDYDREFEVSQECSELRVLKVYSDVPPVKVSVSPGDLTVKRLPGFFEVNAAYDPPLPGHRRLRQQVHYELNDVYGDPEDYWFYTIPTSFGSCNPSIIFPKYRAPTSFTVEFESDGFKSIKQAPDPIISESELVYQMHLDSRDAQFRRAFFRWEW